MDGSPSKGHSRRRVPLQFDHHSKKRKLNMSEALSTEVLSNDANPIEAIGAIERANIDMAVSTAKKYPRNISRVKAEAIAMATMDDETAASCFYAMPRAGKTISGPSVRCAEIVLSCWGNIRAGSRVIGNDGKVVKSQAFCHDLEKNVMVTVEKDRKITGKDNKTFNEDMIVVTGNAAAAIALRDATFKAIPRSLVQSCYNACRQLVAGDAKPMSERINKALKQLAAVGVKEKEILTLYKIQSKDQITGDQLADLFGLYNAIKDGEITPAECFKNINETDAETAKEILEAFRSKMAAPTHETTNTETEVNTNA